MLDKTIAGHQGQRGQKVKSGQEEVKRAEGGRLQHHLKARGTQRVEMARVSPLKITLAPAFYACQVDIAGPFYVKVRRMKVKCWAVLFVCVSTTATSIAAMEDYSTEAFIKALQRHSSRYGYPLFLLPDQGTQLVKGCTEAKFDFKDLQQAIHTNQSFQVRISAVKCHEEHGLVERRIRTMRDILQKMSINHRVSVLDWETVFCIISNTINSMPLAIRERSVRNGKEIIDFLSPNTLLLGRNNWREPSGRFKITSDVGKIIEMNAEIMEDFYRLLFEQWNNLIPRTRVRGKFKVSLDKLEVGDIVLFQQDENLAREGWSYGRVVRIQKKRYRKVIITYKNEGEGVWKETERSERDCVLIKGINEVDVGTHEHLATLAADLVKGLQVAVGVNGSVGSSL